MSHPLRAPALSVNVSPVQVVITVPGAYRLWPHPPEHQVLFRWGTGGLLVADLPGRPVVLLSASQRDRLERTLRERSDIPLLMVDHCGRHRLCGQLHGSETTEAQGQ